MPSTLAGREAGFSLIDVIISLAFFVAIVTTLMGYHRALIQSFDDQWQYRQLWRVAYEQADILPPPLPSGWYVDRVQTSVAGCVSITATVTTSAGRQGQLVRRHCKIN